LNVLLDALTTSARRLLSRPRDREELHREPVNPWDDHIAPLFNDSNFAPVTCDTVCDGITTADISGIDPPQLPHQRSSSQLSEKWAKLRSEYTKTLDNFQRSGQLECDFFPRFAHGKGVIIYLRGLANAPAGSVLLSMATQLLEQGAREEVGIDVADLSNSTAPDPLSSRKRGRDSRLPQNESVERQSELRMTGLEGFNMRPDPDSEFHALHLGIAEASKGHAENVRAILQALRDVTSMFCALGDEGEGDVAMEKAAYTELKKYIFIQLADARDKEQQRQKGPSLRGSECVLDSCSSVDSVGLGDRRGCDECKEFLKVNNGLLYS
jgi:hypothetical protein